jgi:transcriptional regulator with AAA-type ATPase domain
MNGTSRKTSSPTFDSKNENWKGNIRELKNTIERAVIVA